MKEKTKKIEKFKGSRGGRMSINSKNNNHTPFTTP